MRGLLEHLAIRAIPGLIGSAAFVAVCFVLAGGWPPEYLVVSSAVGGMLSPGLWWLIARIRDGPAPPAGGRADDG